MNNQSITLDESRVVYATEFVTVSETGHVILTTGLCYNNLCG